uniref:Regulator of G-protein signaling 3-like n=1 Tax=Neolamprologus brichardi TaxID=32507 RepID=A0A3Q4N3T0_NEOBR
MRRFSSEGSLLDLDFPTWKKEALKNSGQDHESGTCTRHLQEDELAGKSGRLTPIIQEPTESPGEMKNELTREHSVSAENLCELSKVEKSQLRGCLISQGSRAYSDSQLAPAVQGSTESVGKADLPPSSPSSSSGSLKMEHRHQQRDRLTAAKLHLKSLFAQSPHSSNSNLTHTEQKDSAKERRSRLVFMHQWSQVGHSRKRNYNRDELEKWAESVNVLLESPTGVSVFGAFLRSEFSEENLQFYLACERYKHSSTNFSLQRRAKDICATYIQPGAPREVHMSILSLTGCTGQPVFWEQEL